MTHIAIDPGLERTGVAIHRGAEVECLTLTPWGSVKYVDNYLFNYASQVRAVIVERWAIHAGVNATMGRELIEAKTIGAIEWLCGLRKVMYVEQQPSTLRPAGALMRFWEIKPVATNRDEASAEKHLWYYMLKDRDPNEKIGE
jgi:hypothetical protein